MVNDFFFGCNVDEMFCMVDVLVFYEEYGEVCFVGWIEGKFGMDVLFEGVVKYLFEEVDKL